MAVVSSALASLIPPRETKRGRSSTATSTSSATIWPGLAARSPPVPPRRTSPAITDAAARAREANSPRWASRVSRRSLVIGRGRERYRWPVKAP